MTRRNPTRTPLAREHQQKLLEIRKLWKLYLLAKRVGVTPYIILTASTGGAISAVARERIERALQTMNVDDFKRFIGLAA